MKKIFIVLICFLSTTLSCCARYVKVSNSNNENILYGKMKYKDSVSGNAYMKNIKTGNSCDGFWFSFIDGSKKDKTANIFGKLECSGGEMFEMNLNPKLSGTAIDQYKHTYNINLIKRKEYKKCTKLNGKCPYDNKL